MKTKLSFGPLVALLWAITAAAQPAPSPAPPVGETPASAKPTLPEPALPEEGAVTVQEKYIAVDRKHGLMLMLVKFPATEREKLPEITRWQGEVGNLMRQWFADGTAAGNWGDLYDNHDGDHSNMDFASFPQLTRIEFAESARKVGLHSGLQVRLLYTGVVLGNSSTALTGGPVWRSQTRLGYTGNPLSPLVLATQYEKQNHLYVYPEHKDYDAGHNGEGGGHGDVFPAHTPYLITSQGSSGSDREFLNAVAGTLAAFRPEVKKLLIEKGALMPTVQMAFRTSQKMVSSPESYLAGPVHRPVFEASQLDAGKMVKLAHEFTTENLPPLVRIRLLEEDLGQPGLDYFDAGPREKLFDTPQAIARVHRSRHPELRMVVAADESRDLAGKPLAYHWKVLQGHSERIEIKPRNSNGSVVEIRVPYHERFRVPDKNLDSNRVDIGVFVHNGTYFSAPALVTVYTLDNEKRETNAAGQVTAIDFTDPVRGKNYFDPLVAMPGLWRDEFRYDEAGQLLGWTRLRGQDRQEFTADGVLVLTRDPAGRPLTARTIKYAPSAAKPNELPQLEQQMGTEIVTYAYTGEGDRRGRIEGRRPAGE